MNGALRMDEANLVALGRIEGKLDMIVASQTKTDQKLEGMDERLRHVEVKAAKSGALSGAIAAVGTAIAVELAKRAL